MTALTEPAKSLRSGLFFTALWVAVYLAAIFLIYLSLPIYSTGKASYMLGLSPCFGGTQPPTSSESHAGP